MSGEKKKNSYNILNKIYTYTWEKFYWETTSGCIFISKLEPFDTPATCSKPLAGVETDRYKGTHTGGSQWPRATKAVEKMYGSILSTCGYLHWGIINTVECTGRFRKIFSSGIMSENWRVERRKEEYTWTNKIQE